MRPRVYTGGTFDCLHFGHINLLGRAEQFGDVTVGLNTDEFVERYKGRAPHLDYRERSRHLLACTFVSSVVECDGDSVATIERVKPQFIVVGSDWARRDYYQQMGFSQDWLDERGIALVYVPRTPGVSTTEIRGRL